MAMNKSTGQYNNNKRGATGAHLATNLNLSSATGAASRLESSGGVLHSRIFFKSSGGVLHSAVFKMIANKSVVL